MTPMETAALAAAAMVLGMAKAGIPGLGVLAIPLAAMAAPARVSTGLLLPLLIVGDIFAVAWYHRSANWKILRSLFPATALGVVAGAILMFFMNDTRLRVVIGVTTLLMLALRRLAASRGEIDPARAPAGLASGVGVAGGVTTMMANASGPIMSLYFLAMRLPKREFIGTSAWFFLVVNLFKVPFSAGHGLITWQSLGTNLHFVPMVMLGAAAGIFSAGKIKQRSFDLLVEILAIVAALRLLLA